MGDVGSSGLFGQAELLAVMANRHVFRALFGRVRTRRREIHRDGAEGGRARRRSGSWFWGRSRRRFGGRSLSRLWIRRGSAEGAGNKQAKGETEGAPGDDAVRR